VRALDLIARTWRRTPGGEVTVARDQLIDSIADAVVVVDRARAVLDMNLAALRLAGSPDLWRGRPVESLLPFLEDAPIAGAAATSSFTIDAGPASYDVRVSRARASGAAWVVMLRDVTEQRRAAAERERFVTQNTELVSRVSHELRTPIAAIQGALQLVLGTGHQGLDGDGRRLLESALRSGERLARIVHEILDISSIDAARPASGPQPVAAERLVIDALLDVSRIAAEKTVRIDSAVVPNLPRLRGDPDHLVQVLVNLLVNAVTHSPAGSTVTVSAWPEKGMVVLAVRDQGPGIGPGRRDTVLGSAGLATSKALVEQHGGRMAIESTPGAGATFLLYLPEAPARHAEPPVSAGPAIEPPAVRILVADDDDDLRGIVTEALEAQGFAVLAAEDGQQAKEVLEREHVDLAVLDLNMPHLTGYEVIREVRRGTRHRDLPVLVLTGSVDERESPDSLGADVLLTKPTDLRRLVLEIKSLLNRRTPCP
jgi:signal transduction histidine kinase/CheY-like chemotaxis protein